uniref:Ovule protein n=1 Tax=Meloidogyne incognita TaxID=6306 RepID=A0A914MAX9_MELIC
MALQSMALRRYGRAPFWACPFYKYFFILFNNLHFHFSHFNINSSTIIPFSIAKQEFHFWIKNILNLIVYM